MRRRARGALLTLILLLASVYAGAQVLDRMSFKLDGQALIPVFGDEQYFTWGGKLSAFADFEIFPFLIPFLQGTAAYEQELFAGGEPLLMLGVGAGVGFAFSPIERLELRLNGAGGYYNAFITYEGEDARVENFYWEGGAEVGLRISPSLSLSVSGGITQYLGPSTPLLTAVSVGVSARLNLEGLGASRVKIEDIKVEPIFPVFYSYYDDHSFGSISVSNGEKNAIKDVKVSFSMPQYMSQPKVCATIASVPPGGSASASLYAIFNDTVLSMTENTRVPAEVIVEYTAVGTRSRVRTPLTLQFFHRNAMSWDDDRRAAAFVSSRDPAALWFAKFVTGIVRDRLRVSLNQNLQFAIGLFEAERLFGLNYVIDPRSSYEASSASASVVDYLQYPYQTIFYRGGDCDDLSILYSSLLQSVGIDTAFITIPGHIFMAFELGMTEQEAKAAFFDPSVLVYRDGQAWVPVEITLVKEGFVKAWRIGAKEWADNVKAGTANFYPMEDSWKLYASVGIPDVNPRFTLPDEVLTVQAFDESVDRFVAREIDPSVREYQASLARRATPDAINRFGILYGRYGMLDEAWAQFSTAAKANYSYAWTNLGNVSFLKKDFPLALSYYEWALKLDPDDTAALLGVARSQYELEHYTEAENAYAELKARNPDAAAKYGYLVSMFGGEGRAWSFADRLSSTVWGEPSQHMAVTPTEPPKVAVAPAAPAPTAQPATPAAPPATTPPASPPAASTEPPATPAPAAEAAAAAPPEAQPAATEVTQPVAPPETTEIFSPPEETTTPAAASEVAAAPEESAASQPEPIAPDETPAAAASAASTTTAETPAPTVAPETPPTVTTAETPAAAATPQVAPEPEPAPPKIAELPPEDVELAEKRTSAAAQATEAEAESPAPQEIPEPEPAPPKIAELPPEDQDLAQKRAEAAAAQATAEAAVPPAAASEPEQTSPAAQPAAEVALLPEAEATAAPPPPPAAEPVPVAAKEPEESEPAAESAPAPAAPEEAAQPETPSAPAPEEAEPATVAVVEEIPPAAAAVPVNPAIVIEGFDSATPGLGEWAISTVSASQTDPSQFFAKLVTPLAQSGKPFRYQVTAKSEGTGWVGLGLHIFVTPVNTYKGYGSGESILVWLTYDPRHLGDAETRLQVYRSYTATVMKLEESVIIPESIFDFNAIAVEMDPIQGEIKVFINGNERLDHVGLTDIKDGVTVIFRALDRATFREFSVEELP
jgi:tetratricopeptide (TPR) repeat protein